LHFRDPPLEPGGQGLIDEGGPNDCREDFMQVGEPLNGIGEGLLVDLGVLPPDAVADMINKLSYAKLIVNGLSAIWGAP
jgi:hypothetical protein